MINTSILRLLRPRLVLIKQVPVFFFKGGMSSTSKATTYEDVLNFWFNESKGIEKYKLWFGGGPDADKTILDKFGGLVLQARSSELAHWEDLSQGVSAGLAFVILIDQFCRNIYRGTADQFSHDYKALNVALKIIESGKDKELSFLQRQFLYLPVEHCESLEMQKKSLQLFGDLATDAVGSDEAGAMSMAMKYAEEHHEVICKFGRYPKRNAALGRENTPEEIEILQNWHYSF